MTEPAREQYEAFGMNTIDNIRWREVQYHRCGCCGTVAGTVLALALWGAIIAAVLALT